MEHMPSIYSRYLLQGQPLLQQVQVLTLALWQGKRCSLPARAATEGMAGANNASAKTKLYVSPSVVFPNKATIP